MMLQAIVGGLRRAAVSPFLLLWLWGINLLVALPAAWIVGEAIEGSIGASRVHTRLEQGFDMEWFGEYEEQARGIARSFGPSLSGAGAFYDNLDGWITGGLFTRHAALVGLGVGYALIWALMLGGVLDRLADRDRRAGARRFFGAGGRHFFRFVRLGVISGLLYTAIYLFADWLFEAMEESTRDVTQEGIVFNYSLLIWSLTALLLVFVHMSFDYAKIATVVEGRRSMLLAAARGVMFVLTRPLQTFGVYLVVVAVSLLVVVFYHGLAPGVGQSSYGAVAWAFLISQVFLVSRLFVRVWLLGAQTVLFQSRAENGPAASAGD